MAGAPTAASAAKRAIISVSGARLDALTDASVMFASRSITGVPGVDPAMVISSSVVVARPYAPPTRGRHPDRMMFDQAPGATFAATTAGGVSWHRWIRRRSA